MKKRFFLFFVLAFLIMPDSALTQSVEVESGYSYKRYTLYDGLPDMKIRGMIQDSQGFIWFGMRDGFSRFDGYEFTSFTPKLQSTVFGMKLDLSGNLIVKGSQYNHRVSDGHEIVSQRMSDSLYYNGTNSRYLTYPYGICENLKGDRKYLVYEHDSTLSVLNMPDELHGISEGKLYYDTLNQWMLFPGEEVFYYHLKKKLLFKINNLSAECFLRYGNNDVLAFDQTGIYRINMSDYSVNQLISHEFDYNITAIELKDGSVMISDYGHLYRFHGNKLEEVASLSMIRDIMLDNENNLWVATYSGVYNFFHLDFVNYSLPESDVVMSMAEDDNHFYWATLNGKLIQKQEETFKNIAYPKFGYSLFSFSQGAASNGQYVYWTLPIGLMIAHNNTFRLADVPLGVAKRVHVKANGNLLFSIINVGVCETTPDGEIVSFYSTEQLQQNVPDVLADQYDRTVVLGTKGLDVIQGENIDFIPNLQGAFPTVGCRDQNGALWLGCESYLNLFYNDTLCNIYQFKGNSIKDILLTKTGWMVLATKLGVALFHPEQYSTTGKFEYLWYDFQNGITALDPHTFGLYEQKDGTVWMMSSEAVVSFRVEQLIEKKPVPLLQLLSLESSADNVSWQSCDINQEIVLPYPQCNVRLNYIGISYSAAKNIRYFIRLNGVQNEWVSYGKNKQAYFSNLEPGNYTFEIYADAGTDDTKTDTVTLKFVVKPAFWQTWWFVAILITTALILISGGIYYFLHSRYEKKNRKLTAEMQINDLKIKSIRLKSIPHFNANVLAAIEYYVMNTSKEEANKLLNTYAMFTNKTLREVEKASRSLNDEIEYVTLYLQLEKLRFREKFDYTIQLDEHVDKSVKLPNMVLHTYCENAVKHGFAGVKKDFLIQIKAVAEANNYVLVSVEDNGIGRAAAAQQQKQYSTKQGLDILKRQIEIYNDLNEQPIIQKVIDLFDDTGNSAGTRFELWVPTNFKYEF